MKKQVCLTLRDTFVGYASGEMKPSGIPYLLLRGILIYPATSSGSLSHLPQKNPASPSLATLAAKR